MVRGRAGRQNLCDRHSGSAVTSSRRERIAPGRAFRSSRRAGTVRASDFPGVADVGRPAGSFRPPFPYSKWPGPLRQGRSFAARQAFVFTVAVAFIWNVPSSSEAVPLAVNEPVAPLKVPAPPLTGPWN